LTDEPISPGDTVHIIVFNAPDFSVITRVSESGDVAFPILGAIHLSNLNSASSAELIVRLLKERNLMLDPNVTVTVDTASTGLTILGEVRSPGIYPPLGKHLLSDLLAAAGGLTANTGRVIEISNEHTPEQKTYIPWDPTMHNTASYDQPVRAGDRVFVRACGIAYVGGNVQKPGAYSLCGSPQMTLSEVIALAGGVAPLNSNSHTFLIRAEADGTKVARQIDIHKVLTAKVADPIIREDDIIYLSHSSLKDALTHIATGSLQLAGPIIYTLP
jgi:polysaccharide export outer membrane protein